MSSDEEAADLHRRAKTVFFEVSEEPRENWDALLEERCAGDERLLAEVASLLSHKEADTSRLMPELEAPSGVLPSQLSGALLAQLGACCE